MKIGNLKVKSVAASLDQLAGFETDGTLKALNSTTSDVADLRRDQVFQETVYVQGVKKFEGYADEVYRKATGTGYARYNYYDSNLNNNGIIGGSSFSATDQAFNWSPGDNIPDNDAYSSGGDDNLLFIIDLGSEKLINHIDFVINNSGNSNFWGAGETPFRLYGLKDGQDPLVIPNIFNTSIFHPLAEYLSDGIEIIESTEMSYDLDNTEKYRYIVARTSKAWQLGLQLSQLGAPTGTDFASLPTQIDSTEVSFSSNKVFYTYGNPATGNITHNLLNAKFGVRQKIYHNDASAPTYPAEWTLIGGGTYQINTLNIIEAEYVDNTRIEYRILQ